MLKTRVAIRLYAVILFSLLLLLAPDGLLADDDHWEAKYWNNSELSGDPVLEQDESKIDYDWGRDAPHEAVDKDEFEPKLGDKQADYNLH